MKIGIFTAMQKESQSFLQHVSKKHKIGNFQVFQLPLGKHEAFLCCPPTVGEIAASAACQVLISVFNVDVVLNFGVVGALTNQSSVLSTLYVGSVVHYGMDTSEIDNIPVGRYACFDDVAVDCDSVLLQKAMQIESLPIVRCASADVFVADGAEKTRLNQAFGAQICDMESAGILFTCKFNNVPCLMVKCVSDSLMGGAGEFSENAQKAAAGFFEFAAKLSDVL